MPTRLIDKLAKIGKLGGAILIFGGLCQIGNSCGIVDVEAVAKV
jgi:hypothetical protein|tara:strand:+ start:2371 stop:2502 length:132 start_codon:yes stop_codon:yes gene_type:complete